MPLTLNSILLIQDDKLCLKVINSHLIRLSPGVVYLSVTDRPKLVTVSRFENDFIFDICCPIEQNIDLPIGPDSIGLPTEQSN